VSKWPDKLSLKCPKCGCGLQPANFFLHATEVVVRKCRRCGRRWSLLIKSQVKEITVQKISGQATFHHLEWREVLDDQGS
jgi:hypothetical protein